MATLLVTGRIFDCSLVLQELSEPPRYLQLAATDLLAAAHKVQPPQGHTVPSMLGAWGEIYSGEVGTLGRQVLPTAEGGARKVR